MKLKNFVYGRWIEGEGVGVDLLDASTGEFIAQADTANIDMYDVLKYGRQIGNTNLRKMTFHERGRMLKSLALYLLERKEKYYDISYKTGATKADSWIDIEGGIGNLFANASLRRKYPDLPYYIEGEPIGLSKGGTFIGHHLMVPKEGVALHINAFNFPIWGMLEKCAVNWMAGVPAVVKPATVTSFLTHAMVEDIVHSGILPEGALQLLCGSAGDILNHVQSQDVVTFTGSASTGYQLKSHQNIIQHAVSFNMEADSLNSIVLGEDVAIDSEDFKVFIKEIRRELTVKCGQKCTAVRRIMVPHNAIDAVQEAICHSLKTVSVGDPRHDGVRMGALVGTAQLSDVKSQLNLLMQESELIFGDPDKPSLAHQQADRGAFMSPILLRQENPRSAKNVHDVEAFGPIATLMPYKGIEEAIQLTKMGKGSLCCSVVSSSKEVFTTFTLGAATHHGRILILNRQSAMESTGHGSPMPMLVHGGPGRAGGGEEMGGMRGVSHYMQRCAIQGTPDDITATAQIFQPGATPTISEKHPFKYYFEDLSIGLALNTAKRTITEYDIVQFANVSWDHFYAHTDVTSLEGTPFTERVAHGYFILSAAAGLFVDAAKGPVLLNYGLDECRFTKPVYAGTTISVRLTVKEKILQERKPDDAFHKGIVKWYVEVFDQLNEIVAVATILTMVRCGDSFGR